MFSFPLRKQIKASYQRFFEDEERTGLLAPINQAVMAAAEEEV